MKHLMERVIPIQILKKPEHGKPCNGCGHCCISEVCSLGKELGDEVVCKALISNIAGSYSCGLVVDPYGYLSDDQSTTWRKIDEIAPGVGEQGAKEFYAYLLGSGRGCDSFKQRGDER
ncbi:hypothetical protein [Flavobacterium sp.]|uniref:hypothetical protein n=1 Tax=Flavobacterium sp. TaxID=239 RepID=UPI002630E38B|nr:hypothetical protein [Flavobacterium sp.]